MRSSPHLFGKITFAFLPSLIVAGPCDIYAAGGTPCVAAHSPVRALFDNYNGTLYQVKRGSDNHTTEIYPLHPGGIANAATQDSFCMSTTCTVSIIYEQTANGNNLTIAPPGSNGQGPQPGGYDDPVLAAGAPVAVNGSRAYGIFIQPNSGYRIDYTTGVAKGNDPEGIYAIFDGTHYNQHCCFDYGNAESDNTDPLSGGNGLMEAIYFGQGDGSGRGTGSGSGPWIMADLENGLYSGHDPINNPADPTVKYRFLAAMVKGNSSNLWAIRGGDATSGSISTFYYGQRPDNGYYPMRKQGSVLLGVGGDNSLGAQGTFYEGAVTSGFPTNHIEDLVAKNVQSVHYAVTSLTSGPAVNVGSSISFKVTTPGFTNRYLAHGNDTTATLQTQVVSSSSNSTLKGQASWTVRTGLGNSGCISFESKDVPGSYIRHSDGRLHISPYNANDKLFREDATFCPEAGLNGQGNLIRSWNYPTRAMRHYNEYCYIAANGGPNYYDDTSSYNNDVSWLIGKSFV